jgi:hypothetical protein
MSVAGAVGERSRELGVMRRCLSWSKAMRRTPDASASSLCMTQDTEVSMADTYLCDVLHDAVALAVGQDRGFSIRVDAWELASGAIPRLLVRLPHARLRRSQHEFRRARARRREVPPDAKGPWRGSLRREPQKLLTRGSWDGARKVLIDFNNG